MRHTPCQQEIRHCHHPQQEKIKTATLIIEIIRKQRYKQDACRILFLQSHINQAKAQKQKQKQAAAKNHRLLGIISQYFSQFTPIQLPHIHYTL